MLYFNHSLETRVKVLYGRELLSYVLSDEPEGEELAYDEKISSKNNHRTRTAVNERFKL